MDPEESIITADATLAEEDLDKTLTPDEKGHSITDQIARYIKGEPLTNLFLLEETADDDTDEANELNFTLANIFSDSRKSLNKRRSSLGSSARTNSLNVTNLLRQFYEFDYKNSKSNQNTSLDSQSVSLPVDLSSLSEDKLIMALESLLKETVDLQESSVNKVVSNLQSEMKKALDHLVSKHSELNRKLDSLAAGKSLSTTYTLPAALVELNQRLDRIEQINNKILSLKKELSQDSAELRVLLSARSVK